MDIWQYKTFIHCKVPRIDCEEHGVVTASVPWASDDAKHFTALFEAQVLVMAMSSMPVSGIAKVLRESDTRIWRMLNRIVDAAHVKADFSGASQIGVDETARRRGHNYLTSFVDLDAQCVMVCAQGRDANTVEVFARELEQHGANPDDIQVVTCDLSPAFARVYPSTSRMQDGLQTDSM